MLRWLPLTSVLLGFIPVYIVAFLSHFYSDYEFFSSANFYSSCIFILLGVLALILAIVLCCNIKGKALFFRELDGNKLLKFFSSNLHYLLFLILGVFIFVISILCTGILLISLLRFSTGLVYFV